MYELFITKSPRPIFNLYIYAVYLFNPKVRDIFDNSNITTQNGKMLITRPDGHTVVDDSGIRVL